MAEIDQTLRRAGEGLISTVSGDRSIPATRNLGQVSRLRLFFELCGVAHPKIVPESCQRPLLSPIAVAAGLAVNTL